ncbi:FliM/FliN family flagellar motor switch protein, partial [Escherichia coli]
MLKYSKTPGIFKLEGNRLGRPYHRLPTLFTGNFDVIDSHLGSYFLKKHRSNITLKKIGCEMDIINKNAELMVSQVGHLAFDIDRSLLLMLLGNFYGLESSLEEAKAHNGLPTKTETRLKNRLALDICTLIFNLQTSGIALKLKLDSSTVITHWAYQLTFTLAGDEESCFRILLDDAHTDFILNLIRHSEHSKPQQVAKSVNKPALIKEIIRS